MSKYIAKITVNTDEKTLMYIDIDITDMQYYIYKNAYNLFNIDCEQDMQYYMSIHHDIQKQCAEKTTLQDIYVIDIAKSLNDFE